MVEIHEHSLSVDEICKYFGIGKDTIYKWIDKYGMLAHRMGRLWKFNKEQVAHRLRLVARLLMSPMRNRINISSHR